MAAGMMVGAWCVPGALAQTDKGAGLSVPDASAGETVAATSHRSTIARMFRSVTTEFRENKLEDVMKFLEDYTGATIEVYWAENGNEGLDRNQTITLKVKNLPALTVLERVLAKANTDALSGGNTWQMTEYGSIECGPKSVLNKNKRTELYDIHDLLMEIPRYDEVPQIDLQSLLQQSQQGGGGGGQSPFRDDQGRNNGRMDQRTLEEKGNDIIRLITTLVEPEEWVEGGGEGGTIRYYNGNILVNAPDYMHRQINGYTYWPSSTAKIVGGRRYVSLNTDNSMGRIDGFAEFPVSAVVGGQVVSSKPGGSTAPAPRPGPGGAAAPASNQPAAPKTTSPASKQPAANEPAKKAPKK
jgi:hypothetical protein